MASPSHALRQEFATKQQMLLLPQMLQSLELLGLPSTELESWLDAQAESNEALLVRPAENSPFAEPALPRSSAASRAATQRHDGWLEEQPGRAASLAERIEVELSMLEVSARRAAWMRWLVGQLDSSGLLSLTDEELLARAHSEGLTRARTVAERERELGEMAVAIATLQQLEPRGLGARSSIEALLLQLDPTDPDYTLLARLLEDFLSEIAKNRLPQVARALGIDLEHLGRLLAHLRALDPAPGRGLVDETTPAIRPEVVVERRPEGGFEVRVEGGAWPSVEIDPELERMAQESGRGSPLARYLRPKIESARSIQGALAQRQRTLARVAVALFAHQTRFLEEGARALVALRMGDLAEELGLALSTVSRAISGKHAQTPWGILPLRWFFQAGAGGEEAQTRDGLRDAVRALFENEDPARPLSDDEALERLRENGFALARRTLAKYRAELGIKSSYLRRRHA
ncbi:MAG: RNA polymerase factor sigma-54 [Planctomycetes bacterium]|nr:RNA polymerase factor sigma-54 [Planctomycetota bacterium]